jgi:hypothetical protein
MQFARGCAKAVAWLHRLDVSYSSISPVPKGLHIGLHILSLLARRREYILYVLLVQLCSSTKRIYSL